MTSAPPSPIIWLVIVASLLLSGCGNAGHYKNKVLALPLAQGTLTIDEDLIVKDFGDFFFIPIIRSKGSVSFTISYKTRNRAIAIYYSRVGARPDGISPDSDLFVEFDDSADFNAIDLYVPRGSLTTSEYLALAKAIQANLTKINEALITSRRPHAVSDDRYPRIVSIRYSVWKASNS